MTVVGYVAGLWRYPVKSMAGESLDDVEVSWNGLAGDRRWAFIRGHRVPSGFPWLTIRDLPELARYRPRFAEPDRPNASPLLVRTPSGADLSDVRIHTGSAAYALSRFRMAMSCESVTD